MIWTKNEAQHQAEKGVHTPWICEISPAQYAGMSKRAKAQYLARRQREWEASGQCKQEYRRLVCEAYERGEFSLDDPAVTGDARTAVAWHKQAIERAELEAEIRDRDSANRDVKHEDLSAGTKVYSIMFGRYLTVTKVLKASIWGVDDKGSLFKTQIGALQWKSYDDCKRGL